MMKIPLIDNDPYLEAYRGIIQNRISDIRNKKQDLIQDHVSLSDFANGHHYFGLHKTKQGWICREWAPNATAIIFISESTGWIDSGSEFHFTNIGKGIWELYLNSNFLKHQDKYKLLVRWNGGEAHRLPIWINRVVIY